MKADTSSAASTPAQAAIGDEGSHQARLSKVGIGHRMENTSYEQFVAQLIEAAYLPSTLDPHAVQSRSAGDGQPDGEKKEHKERSPGLPTTLVDSDGLPKSTSHAVIQEVGIAHEDIQAEHEKSSKDPRSTQSDSDGPPASAAHGLTQEEGMAQQDVQMEHEEQSFKQSSALDDFARPPNIAFDGQFERGQTQHKHESPKRYITEVHVVIEVPDHLKIEKANVKSSHYGLSTGKDDVGSNISSTAGVPRPRLGAGVFESRAKTESGLMRKSMAEPRRRFGMFHTAPLPNHAALSESSNIPVNAEKLHSIRRSTKMASRKAASQKVGAAASGNSHGVKVGTTDGGDHDHGGFDMAGKCSGDELEVARSAQTEEGQEDGAQQSATPMRRSSRLSTKPSEQSGMTSKSLLKETTKIGTKARIDKLKGRSQARVPIAKGGRQALASKSKETHRAGAIYI